MEWLGLAVLFLLVTGIGLALREWRTGRGKILDERPKDPAQTETDRNAIRTSDAFRGDGDSPPH